NDPRLIRRLKDTYHALKKTHKTLFILSPLLTLPSELEREVTVVDVGLPDVDEATVIFESAMSSMFESPPDALDQELREKCIRAVLGLGAIEMELALRRTFLVV
ncbi:MAG: hypothetical protein QXZ06_06370, partial [Candidatus Jordarchaeales archaeon]